MKFCFHIASYSTGVLAAPRISEVAAILKRNDLDCQEARQCGTSGSVLQIYFITNLKIHPGGALAIDNVLTSLLALEFF